MQKDSTVLDPYDVLDVSRTASNADITKAFTLATKRKQYSIDVIAKARKRLMNTKERLMADYLRPIMPTVSRLKRQNFSALKIPSPALEFLPEFDGLEAAIAQADEVSTVDKRLGAILFSPSPVKPFSSISAQKVTPTKSHPANSEELSNQTSLNTPHASFQDSGRPSQSSANSTSLSGGHKLGIAAASLFCLGALIGVGIASQQSTPLVSSSPTEPQSTPSELENSTSSDSYIPPSPAPEAGESTIPSPSSSTSSSYDFPMSTCGDSNFGSTNTWYPVFVDYSEANLDLIRNNYCRDAIKNYREEKGLTSIQVASFIDPSKAQEFAELMENQVGDGEVGNPKYLTDSKVSAASQKVLNFPMSTCGNSDPGGTNTWHPVFVDYSEANLELIRNNYCRDAIKNYREEKGLTFIQAASFLDRSKAEEFADLISNKVDSAEVGEPSAH